MTTIESWEIVAEALHQFHPKPPGIPYGKGICEYQPCILAREVRNALRELDKPARAAELVSNRARVERETP